MIKYQLHIVRRSSRTGAYTEIDKFYDTRHSAEAGERRYFKDARGLPVQIHSEIRAVEVDDQPAEPLTAIPWEVSAVSPLKVAYTNDREGIVTLEEMNAQIAPPSTEESYASDVR